MTPARADLNPNYDITISIPDALALVDVTDKLSVFYKRQMGELAKPNQMTNIYFPIFYLEEQKENRTQNLPNDLVIFAVPKGNPTVEAHEFHKLKDALKPLLSQSGATLFADKQLWMGATKSHTINDGKIRKTYIYSTLVMAIKSKVVMLQFLHLYKSNDDLDLFHQMMASLADHMLKTNNAYPQKPHTQVKKVIVPNIKK